MRVSAWHVEGRTKTLYQSHLCVWKEGSRQGLSYTRDWSAQVTSAEATARRGMDVSLPLGEEPFGEEPLGSIARDDARGKAQ